MVQSTEEDRAVSDDEYSIIPDEKESSAQFSKPEPKKFYRVTIHTTDGTSIVRDFEEKETAYAAWCRYRLPFKRSDHVLNLESSDVAFSINPDNISYISLTPETTDPVFGGDSRNFRILKRTPRDFQAARFQTTVGRKG